MRRKSRRIESSDANASLELLLDTICNTFGGILFISLLVVVLLNTTSKAVQTSPPSEVSALDLLDAEIKRDELTRELARLREAASQQESTIDQLIPEDVIALAQQVKREQDNRSQLLIDKSAMDGRLAKSQQQINQTTKQMNDRRFKLNAARDQAVALRKVLDDTVRQSSKKATIPKASDLQLSSMTYFLKGGKLYGPRTSANTADFVYGTNAAGQRTVMENPSGGVPIDPTGDNTAAVTGKTRGIRPSEYGIRVFVWPDSYGHWEAVRQELDERQFKKWLVPCDDDDEIVLGPASNGSGTFQ